MTIADFFKNISKTATGIFTGTTSQQIQGMMAGIFPGGTGQPPRRGTKELLNAYNTMPWLRAVTNKVSRSVASTTWRIYTVEQNGKAIKSATLQRGDFTSRQKQLTQLKQAGALREIDEHPLLTLLNDANPFMTGLVAKQLIQIYLELVGEAFLLKERNAAGVPIAIWPLPPDWIIDTPTPDDPTYRVSYAGFNALIPDTDILWIVDPDPINPYGRGSGMAKVLADELETDEYAAKHSKSWFYNRARPDVVISADGLTPEETRRLEQDWLSKNQGFWKVYKPYFMGKKVDIQTLSQSFEDMQLVELREFERDTIIQVYGMPPELLGIVENSNRATIDGSDYLFSRWLIQPRLEFLRSYFQEKLVQEFDDRLIIEYDNPIPEDKEYKLKVAQAAPWSLTVDEWRAMQGKEPLPNKQGNVYMLPFNLYPSAQLATMPQEPASNQQEGIKSKAIKKDWIDDIYAQMVEAIQVGIISDAMKPLYKAIIEEFGEDIMEEVGAGIRFDLLNPRITHFIETESATYIKEINNTTLDAVRQQLSEGVANGESIDDIALRINAVFDDANARRSITIARTETGRAANFATVEGMKQSGVKEKEWLATRDERVRDAHLAMDRQVQPVDKPFIAPDGSTAMYPGGFGIAGLDVNCRCATKSVINGKTMYPTETKRVAAWKAFDDKVQQYERMVKMEIRKAFDKQRKNALEVLNGGE